MSSYRFWSNSRSAIFNGQYLKHYQHYRQSDYWILFWKFSSFEWYTTTYNSLAFLSCGDKYYPSGPRRHGQPLRSRSFSDRRCRITFFIEKCIGKPREPIETPQNDPKKIALRASSRNTQHKLGSHGRAPSICFKIGMCTHMGLNANLAEETHLGIDI